MVMGSLWLPGSVHLEVQNSLDQCNVCPCLRILLGRTTCRDPSPFWAAAGTTQARCLHAWHTPSHRPHQIPQRWEPPKRPITPSRVPSTAFVSVTCGDVVRCFCLSLQHFLWWISFLSVALFSVCADWAHSEAWQNIQHSPHVWKPRRLDMEEENTEEATCRPPWSQKPGMLLSGDAPWVSTALFVWIRVTLLHWRRRYHLTYNAAAQGSEKPSDLPDSTQVLSGSTKVRIQGFSHLGPVYSPPGCISNREK